MLPNYVVISDIHLFHRRTPTQHIIDSLWLWLNEHEQTLRKCKLFFIAGDIFDRYIPSHYGEIQAVNKFFFAFGVWLTKLGISLIVLEGTSTHDRKQFLSILPILKATKTDVHYYDTVTVGIHHDMSILFVPDNWSTSPDITLNDAKKAITNVGLTQVDIGIIHGAYDYQLPMMKDTNLCQREFESLVKYTLHTGHIHTESTNGKVRVQGSFDRIAHGEPENKGGDAVIQGKLVRLVNTNALAYVTVDVSALDLSSAQSKLNEVIRAMGGSGYLRVKASRKHPIFEYFPKLMVDNLSIKFERQYNADQIMQPTIAQLESHALSNDDIIMKISEWKKDISQSTISLISDLLGKRDVTKFQNYTDGA